MKMYARVARRVTSGAFSYSSGQFPRPAERLAVWHDFSNHSPFLRNSRSQRVWVEQESFRPVPLPRDNSRW